MRKVTETTTTFLVMEALRAADDFLTVRQLMGRTGRSSNRVTAALHAMRNHNAVDFIVSGATYWYARPKEEDTRIKTVDERVPETKPRKSRKKPNAQKGA